MMAVALAIAVVLLYILDPMTAGFSYRCPVKALTGLDCPGCGGQRAIHALLHLRFKEAIGYNPFLIIVALYISAVIFIGLLRGPRISKVRRIILGERVAWLYIALMFTWTIVRNLHLF